MHASTALRFSLAGRAVLLVLALSWIPCPGLARAEGQEGREPSSDLTVAPTRGAPQVPAVFVYEPASRRLALYQVGPRGIEPRGVRCVAWDLRLEELHPVLARKSALPVAAIRQALERSPTARGVDGDPPGARCVLAPTRGSSGDAWAFLMDGTSDRLAAYRAGAGGIELKGVRRITWDLLPEDLQTTGGQPSVAQMRQMAESTGASPATGGAASGSRRVLAAATRGRRGEPWVFVHDVEAERLGAYVVGGRGIELRGMRRVTWDLRLDALPASVGTRGGRVRDVRAAAEASGSERAAASTVRLAVTRGATEEPVVFLHDESSGRLATYRVAPRGLDLLDVRGVLDDLELEDGIPGAPARGRRRAPPFDVQAPPLEREESPLLLLSASGALPF